MTHSTGRSAAATAAARRALLRACLATDDDLPCRLADWEASVDLDDIDGESLALVPFLHVRLRRAGVAARDAGRIKGIYARAWYVAQSTGDGAAAEHSGTDAVVIRGLAVRELAYGGEPTRALDDTAVLRRPEGGALVAGGLPVVDRLADTTADTGVVGRALASATPLPTARLRSPAPAYHLLDALLRGTGWQPPAGLVVALDAGLLAGRLDAADWEVVVDEVRRCGWRPLVLPPLRELSGLGAPVPAAVLDRLSRQPASAGAVLLVAGSRRTGWRRRALRGAYGLYLSDPDRARGPRALVDYPVRNARLAAAALRRRRSG